MVVLSVLQFDSLLGFLRFFLFAVFCYFFREFYASVFSQIPHKTKLSSRSNDLRPRLKLSSSANATWNFASQATWHARNIWHAKQLVHPSSSFVVRSFRAAVVERTNMLKRDYVEKFVSIFLNAGWCLRILKVATSSDMRFPHDGFLDSQLEVKLLMIYKRT